MNDVFVERNGTLTNVYEIDTKAQRLVARTVSGDNRSSIKQFLFTAFLPIGYPKTVSDDYVQYQLFDSCQALCSSITGSLASAAILKGVGVGNAEANVASAMVNYIVRDGANMTGRILFSWAQGTNLDANSKFFRLLADFLNDVAICLDMLTNHAAPYMFLPMVCTSSVLRAIVGVAGGATKAAVSQHQARANNIGDVLAKDGSQETAVGLTGMLLSLLIVPNVADNLVLTWLIVLLGVALHLYCNYRAVRSIAFQTLNRQRFAILMDEHRQSNAVLTPRVVADREIVDRPWLDETVRRSLNGGWIEFGCSLDVLAHFARGATLIRRVLTRVRDDGFAVYLVDRKHGNVYINDDDKDSDRSKIDADDGNNNNNSNSNDDDNNDDDDGSSAAQPAQARTRPAFVVCVCLRENLAPIDVLRAFFVARSVCFRLPAINFNAATGLTGVLKLGDAQRRFDELVAALEKSNWNVATHLLAPGDWRMH